MGNGCCPQATTPHVSHVPEFNLCVCVPPHFECVHPYWLHQLHDLTPPAEDILINMPRGRFHKELALVLT